VSYEFIEHTADIRLRAEGDDLKTLLLELAAGMNEFLFGETSSSSTEILASETVEIVSPDVVSLVVDWLSRLLLLSSIHHGKAVPLEITHISERELRASIAVYKAEQIEDIKAVTYHGLEVTKTPHGIEACVTFDI